MGLAILSKGNLGSSGPLVRFARAFRPKPCYGFWLFAPVGAAFALGEVCSLNDDLLACIPIVFWPLCLGSL